MSGKWWVINKEKRTISLAQQTRVFQCIPESLIYRGRVPWAACGVRSCYEQNIFKDVPESWCLKDDGSFHKKTSEGGTKLIC